MFGDCGFAAVLGCFSPAKLTDSKNEPPVVGAFLILSLVSSGYRYIIFCAFRLVGLSGTWAALPVGTLPLLSFVSSGCVAS